LIKTELDYVNTIKKYYESDDPKLHAKIKYQVNKWYDFLTPITYAAKNEKKPWSEKELDMAVLPMPRKELLGFQQTGDYITVLSTESSWKWCPLMIERKSCEDLYGTFMNSNNRKRFYRELDRFESIEHFNQFIVMAECSLGDFLSYKPKFTGNKYNTKFSGASVRSRRATIAALFTKGYPIMFCDTRASAIKMYKYLVRKSVVNNYVKMLALE